MSAYAELFAASNFSFGLQGARHLRPEFRCGRGARTPAHGSRLVRAGEGDVTLTVAAQPRECPPPHFDLSGSLAQLFRLST